MYDAQVGTLQRQRQGIEEGLQVRALRGVRERLEGGVLAVLLEASIEEPGVSVLVLSRDKREFVIADDPLRVAVRDEFLHPTHRAETSGSPITQVADEDEVSAVRVASLRVVAQTTTQVVERVELAVHVTDDVEWAVEQWADE